MTARTAALSKLFIGPVASSSVDTQGEFEALSFTQVGEITGIGELGDEANIINHVSLSDRRVRKLKGSFDAGNLEFEMAYDGADSGQAAMIAALAADDDYAFKVTFNDGPQGSPSQPTTLYFRGQVAMFRWGIPNADSVLVSRGRIAISSAIVRVGVVS